MKIIPLTQNKFSLISDRDYKRVMQHKWYFHSKLGYAMSNYGGKKLYLHRFILETPKGMETDHKNGNKLDNRRCNLRIATHQQNSFNRNKEKSNTSGHKGITWYQPYRRWRAYINFNNRFIHLGYFTKIDKAIDARNRKERELFKEFSYV